MPKNKGKGGKKFRRGKHTNETKRPLLLKDEKEAQCYGHIIKTLGNGRFEVNCYEDINGDFVMKSRVCLVRGSMRKRVWINMGDIVLISLRTFQDSKADIMYKYEDYEINDLIKLNQIPDIADINTTDNLLFNNDDEIDVKINSSSYNDVYNMILINDGDDDEDNI
jgi:translation initiation factor 1A